MPEEGQSDSLDLIGECLVYGITDRDRAVRLIEALAEIPCCPLRIFRINARRTRGDRLARWLGVHDRIAKCIYYVRVIHWGSRRKNSLPVIGWSLDPKRYSSTLGSRAFQADLEYCSALRLKPMVVNYDPRSMTADHAKRALSAS